MWRGGPIMCHDHRRALASMIVLPSPVRHGARGRGGGGFGSSGGLGRTGGAQLYLGDRGRWSLV